MNFSIEIRPEAVADVETAAEWYEKQRVGLAADFVRTVIEAIEGLAENPLAYRLRDRRRDVRWSLTNRFPYKVVYQIQESSILRCSRCCIPPDMNDIGRTGCD